MKCPFCGHQEDRVVDSRAMSTGDAIRRRRECLACNKRFTTYEQIEDIPIMIKKRDNRREPYNRLKVLAGLRKACQKRPISEEQIEEMADDIERLLHQQDEREVEATLVGEAIMERLRNIDHIAYVRFASVYREFKTVEDFMNELKGLMGGRSEPEGVKGES